KAEFSVEDLMAHAQATIDERPAWPKIIQVIEAIPLTSVGKIFKPSLRCDAAKLVVSRVLEDELGVADAEVDVVAGGPRGLCVSVTLGSQHRSSVTSVEKALEAFLFEAQVDVA
ncbi:MAG: acyl-CoA synthetase, partial [Dinoroseobacter sp.]|nr:acyl-CoA synthetase [Dinoroseobacter sp.]